eukprot:TRINITY_DN9879_c0_g1_i3.p2 TRINITY_DN9879_c0_g1~~TRINITY_DN9879_c0_g1_i3.p2  ORF type:complete len:109 (-),score=5.64 TRINITY_DN9879_c0_g1_i3:4-330(-)
MDESASRYQEAVLKQRIECCQLILKLQVNHIITCKVQIIAYILCSPIYGPKKSKTCTNSQQNRYTQGLTKKKNIQGAQENLSLIHISEPTRRTPISYAVFCLKKKKTD